MSLQAKIEAVIYASEEPVTLAQLMGLLGEEAQAELDALESQQGTLGLAMDMEGDPQDRLGDSEAPAGEAPGDNDALNAELLDNPALSEEPEPAAELAPSESSGTEDAGSEPPLHAVEAATAPEPVPAAADEKKQAREKERRLREYFRSLLDRLIAEYANSDRGLEIREVAGGFRMATRPEYHDAVRGFVKSLKPPMKLSLQALETLAVIAYKQPVTAPEISEIRGVESGGVLGTLMARKLIGTAGRKAVIGRPMLYKTTKEFLLRFGLKDINELPSIEEFEKMAGELAEPIQEEIPMADATREAADRTSEEAAGLHDTGTEGTPTEPNSGVSQEAAAAVSEQVEPSRNIHEAQADGVPDTPATDTRAIDNHEPYTGSDETGA